MNEPGRRNHFYLRIVEWQLSGCTHLMAVSKAAANIAAPLLFLLATGCAFNSAQVADLVDAVSTAATNVQATASTTTNSTEAVEQEAAPTPQPVVVESAPMQAATAISAGTFARPAIACGSDGRLYVAAEGAGMQSIWLYVQDKAGKWGGGQVAKSERGGLVNSSRVYVPDIVVDADGWCWVSMRCGPKEWGELHGPAVWIRTPSGTGSWRFLNLTTGAARICLAPEFPGAAVLLTKNGVFGVIDRTGRITKQATFPAGMTGEKFAFDISSSGGSWASAHNGYGDQASAVAIGNSSGGKRQTWAAYEAYGKWYGNDLCYPDVVIGLNGSVYCQSVLDNRLRLQVFEKGKARFPMDRLADLGQAVQEDRCPPRLIATKRGVQAVFVRGDSIYRMDVEKALAGQAVAVRICQGRNPSVCVDKLNANRMHMAYINGGSLLHKIIEL
jgi:hypothetical protein